MAEYREIVTKAIIGKGKKSTTDSYSLTTEEKANTVLGCWVINHTFSGATVGDKVLVNGSFDVNVWYSYDNDSKTAVSTKRFNYTDTMKMKSLNDIDVSSEVIVKSLKQPTVSDVSVNDGVVNLNIDKELGIELVGDTKVRVPIEAIDDDYELIEDDIEDKVDTVNVDYLK